MNKVLCGFAAMLWVSNAHSLDNCQRLSEQGGSARKLVVRDVDSGANQKDLFQVISGIGAGDKAKMVARTITREPDLKKKLSLFAMTYRMLSRDGISVFEKELKRLGWRIRSSKRGSISKKKRSK